MYPHYIDIYSIVCHPNLFDRDNGHQDMCRIAAEHGYEMGGNAVPMNEDLLNSADLIIIMTEWHREKITRLLPYDHWNRIVRFNDFCFGETVVLPDPHFQAEHVYRTCFDRIETGCKEIVNKLDVTTTSEVSEWNLKGALVPTIGEFEELRNNCNWEWIEQKGVDGYKITGRTENAIFIPFSGECKDYSFRIFGRLFTRESLYNDSQSGQYYLYFSHGEYKLAKYACDYICPVRLIKKKMKEGCISVLLN